MEVDCSKRDGLALHEEDAAARRSDALGRNPRHGRKLRAKLLESGALRGGEAVAEGGQAPGWLALRLGPEECVDVAAPIPAVATRAAKAS